MMADSNQAHPHAASSNPRPSRWKRVAKWLIALVAVLLVATYFTLHALVELPRPSGPFPVGQRAVVFTDLGRADPWSGAPEREILVYAFYPATKQGSPASYFPHLGTLAKNFDRADALLVRALPVFLTPAASEDTPLAATPVRLPVVLFSPGGGTAVFMYRTLLEDLASHGYLVLAVEPTHEGVGQVFPDGRVTDPIANREGRNRKDPAEGERYYRKCVGARADDLSFIAQQLNDDTLGKVRPEWVGRIDAACISSLGHSIGGVAAVEAARHEPRIIAGTNLDGHFKDYPCLPDAEPVAQHAAVLVIEDDSPQVRDAARQPQDAAALEALAKWRDRQVEIEAHLASTFRESDKLLLGDMQHSDFSDQPFFYPHLKSSIRNANQERLTSIRDKLRGFLDRQCSRASSAER